MECIRALTGNYLDILQLYTQLPQGSGSKGKQMKTVQQTYSNSNIHECFAVERF
jgi:hypothetical protein